VFTAGSRGIRESQDYVRRAGTAACMMLTQAAAEHCAVAVEELSVSAGMITHTASKRTTSFGKVAAAAAKRPAPDMKAVTLKDPKQWKIAGKSIKRLDTADKLTGAKVYAIDLKLPCMLCAAVKACPVFGGKLVSFDDSSIKAPRDARGRRHRRSRCPHVVARQVGTRRPCDRLGRG